MKSGMIASAIWSVSDRNQTTEEILRELRTDPDVIAAEPNYIAYAANEEEAEAEPEEAVEAAEAETEEPEADNTEPTVTKGDLSPMQWSNGSPGSEAPAIYTTPLSPTAGYTMEVPGWQEGRTNPNAPANAGGTICIMDTGVDTDHPDLQRLIPTARMWRALLPRTGTVKEHPVLPTESKYSRLTSLAETGRSRI